MKISITESDVMLHVRFQGGTRQFEAALAAMKQDIPCSGRRFDAEDRCWVIERRCQGHLDRWLSRMRQEMNADVVYHDRQFSHVRSSPLKDAYTTLHLLPTAPPELIRVVYRCLATIHHPDRGGDTKSMQAINLAYDQLSAGRA